MPGGHDDRDAPFLLTLGLDAESFDRLDRLRCRFFPPGLNQIPAHVSLFHHLPPGEGRSIRATLAEVAASTPPVGLTFATPFRLGRGMAVRVEAPDAGPMHASLARAFGPWLTPQDRQPFRPHVTLMNKATPREAGRAFASLLAGWSPWSGVGESLLLWRYLGGPWEPAGVYPLAGSSGGGPSDINTLNP